MGTFSVPTNLLIAPVAMPAPMGFGADATDARQNQQTEEQILRKSSLARLVRIFGGFL